MNCGQTCIRPDYALVHDSVAERFLLELRRVTTDMYGEDPRKSDFYGRLINTRAHVTLWCSSLGRPLFL